MNNIRKFSIENQSNLLYSEINQKSSHSSIGCLTDKVFNQQIQKKESKLLIDFENLKPNSINKDQFQKESFKPQAQNNKQLVIKNKLGEQLIQSIPIKFKKQLRKLIQFYEDQIRKIKQQVKQSKINQYQLKLKQQNQILDKKLRSIQQKYTLSENNCLKLQIKYVDISKSYQQLIKSKIQLLKENENLKKFIHNLKLNQSNKSKIYDSNISTTRNSSESKIQISNYFPNLQQISLESISIRNSPKRFPSQKTDEISTKSLIKQKKIKGQEKVSLSIFKRQQKLKNFGDRNKFNSQEIISSMIKLLKQKQKKNKNLSIEPNNSETEQIDFSKEKVIEKKKIRTFFLNLINIIDKNQRKQLLIEISNDIDLSPNYLPFLLQIF